MFQTLSKDSGRKVRITIDTNIFVAATFWLGASHRVLNLVEEGKIELILSKDIIQEFIDVLGYEEIKQKVKNKNLEMMLTIEKLKSISIIIEPKEKLDTVKEDPADNKILECAFEGNAGFIISKDNHLLKLKEFEGIKIMTPEEFLEII